LEKIIIKLDKFGRSLDEYGLDDNDKRSNIITSVLISLLYILLFSSLFFLIPVKIISLSLIGLILIPSIIFLIRTQRDEGIENNFILILGFTFLPLSILSLKILMKFFVPYGGDDPMKLRAQKIKILIRKTRINKLKFWK